MLLMNSGKSWENNRVLWLNSIFHNERVLWDYLSQVDTFLKINLFFFFFLKIFWCGPFLKFLLNLLQYCFCFMFWFFGPEARGILAPLPGIEPTPPALEGEVLTTGQPGKSQSIFFQSYLWAQMKLLLLYYELSLLFKFCRLM